MQSYKVDQLLHEACFMEATFTPLAFGTHWLPGVGAGTRSGSRASADRIERRPPLRLAPRAGSGRTRGGQRISYGLQREPAKPLLRYRPGRRDLVRGGRERGLSADQRRRRSLSRQQVTLRLAGALGLGGSTRGIPSDGNDQDRRARRAASSGLDGAVRGHEGLFVADASVLPTAMASTR